MDVAGTAVEGNFLLFGFLKSDFFGETSVRFTAQLAGTAVAKLRPNHPVVHVQHRGVASNLKRN